MRRKLTDLAVSRTRSPAKGRIEIWDTLLPGFGVRLSCTGLKTWIVAIRRPGERHPVRLKVGTIPPMALAEARDRAREIMARGAPARQTFGETAQAFLKHGRSKKGRPLRPATVDAYRKVLNGYAAPLQKRSLSEITRREIADLLAEIAAGSGAPTAALVRSLLGRFFGYAIETGRLEVNPVTGSPSYIVPKRSRVLSDAELRALWETTEEPIDHNMIVRLCLWLGCRRGEAGGMRWSELHNGAWAIPASRTKNHRVLVLPLPRQAIAALEAWPRLAGRDLLFGRTSSHGFAAWSDAKERLDRQLRFNRDWDLHDLRRVVETRMAGLGVPKDHATRVLNHAVGAITEAYDLHTYDVEKATALQRWADELQRITGAT